MRSRPLDRSRLHIASNPQALSICAIAHLVQLFDRDVIALAILHARVGKVAQQQQNRRCRTTELEISLGLAWHKSAPRKETHLNSTRLAGWNQGYRAIEGLTLTQIISAGAMDFVRLQRI